MKIVNSQLSDLPVIFDLYRNATELMRSKNQVHWPEFTEELITTEIKEQRQWNITINKEIACIWATSFNDELIWGSIDNEPSVYIHRITTASNYRGQNLVQELINWAMGFGKKHNLRYIRLDTVGHNKGLIKYYKKIGFQFLGMKPLKNTEGLSDHYKMGEVCYFQQEIF